MHFVLIRPQVQQTTASHARAQISHAINAHAKIAADVALPQCVARVSFDVFVLSPASRCAAACRKPGRHTDRHTDRRTDRSSSHPKDGAHDVSQGTRITTSSSSLCSSAGQTSSTPSSSSSARITSQDLRPALVRRRCCLCSASASASCSAFASVSIFDFHLHLEAAALGSRLIVVRRVSLTGRSSRVLCPVLSRSSAASVVSQ